MTNQPTANDYLNDIATLTARIIAHVRKPTNGHLRESRDLCAVLDRIQDELDDILCEVEDPDSEVYRNEWNG